jgi:hypothetical protein
VPSSHRYTNLDLPRPYRLHPRRKSTRWKGLREIAAIVRGPQIGSVGHLTEGNSAEDWGMFRTVVNGRSGAPTRRVLHSFERVATR